MKGILLGTLCFFSCIFSIQAQILYGTTLTGGSHGAGTINKLITSTNDFTTVYSPEGVDGRDPQFTKLTQAANGKLYGVTLGGGTYNAGTIFSYDPSSSTFTKIKDFGDRNHSAGNEDGGFPYGSLVQAGDGKLYGMTAAGGKGTGVIFSYDPSTLTFVKLRDFEINTGWNPQGDLIQGSDGKLYGMTANGGTQIPGSLDFYNLGVIFSFDPLTSAYTVLKTFTPGDGVSPKGSLVQADNGKLYGMAPITNETLPYGDGCIFSLDPATAEFTLVYNFDSGAGKNPRGSLIKAGNGKLYGTAQSDDTPEQGLIFSFDPATSMFALEKDGVGNLPGSLAMAGDGRFYGMSGSGSPGNDGSIFSFDPATKAYATVYNFDNINGSNPVGSLLQAADGKLYGMTSDGGSNNDVVDPGVIFSFDPSSSDYTKLKNFGGNDGSRIPGALLLASDGKLYGMTVHGGASDKGIIFSYDTLTSAYSKLKEFSDTDGATPNGSLLEAFNGKLYGMTPSGGKGWGVIFSYDPVTTVYTVLHYFDNTDGARPFGSLVEAPNGKFYGLTSQGGTSGRGVIFSFDPSSSAYTKLKDLLPEDGSFPYGSLLAAVDGKLYGLSSFGGTGFGTIFSIDPSTSAFTKLKDFDLEDGAAAEASLIQASNGKLYGVTNTGGSSSNGVIFSFDPVGAVYKVLANFDGTNTGSSPSGTLLQASDGKLYGITSTGGSSNLGVVFSFNIATATLSKLQDLDGINGADPYIGSAFIEAPECTTSFTYYEDADGDGYGNPYRWKIARKTPSGYVADNKDCDDRNKDIHPMTYYRDADGDSFGDANISISICAAVAPAGYSKNKSDDDDKRKLAYRISNFPNPFTETSVIKYALPFDSKVSLKVYDLSGRPVATLVDDNKKAGFYSVTFKAGGLSSGMLFYRITAVSNDQHYEQTNKMILLR